MTHSGGRWSRLPEYLGWKCDVITIDIKDRPNKIWILERKGEIRGDITTSFPQKNVLKTGQKSALLISNWNYVTTW